MNILDDIITYIRRIIKSPSDAVISDSLIVDYINRFWLLDMDARMQLFDFKTVYRFQTTPGIDSYNMPLYTMQTELGGNEIFSYPVYQGFLGPCFVNGIGVPFYTQRDEFWNLYPNYVQQQFQVGTGDGTTGPYSFSLPYSPAIPGHIDLSGIISYINVPNTYQDPIFTSTFQTSIPVTSVFSGVYLTATGQSGQNIVVADSGQFLSGNTGGDLYGLLMAPGNSPFGNTSLGVYDTTTNTVNYNNGSINVSFPEAIPDGTPIQAQCYFYNQGIPRAVLYYNNTLTLRPPSNVPYLVELTAYLTPAAFLTTSQAIPFAYMSEYVARGAARKILSDTGDVEQFNFYEPLFREQEQLVWKRSQRTFTSTRTQTLFSSATGLSSPNAGVLGFQAS